MNKKNKLTINSEDPSAFATEQAACVQISPIRSFQHRNHQIFMRKHLSIDNYVSEKLEIRVEFATVSPRRDFYAPIITTAV